MFSPYAKLLSTMSIAHAYRALGDPTRREILRLLREGDLAAGDLAGQFEISWPSVSRHLKVLEQAGLVSRSRRATARLSHLEAAPLREATAWLARYREYWEESYERLDELLAALQDPKPTDARKGAPHE